MRTSMLFARNLPRRLARAQSNPFVRQSPVMASVNPSPHGGYTPRRYSAAPRYGNPRASLGDNYAEGRVAAIIGPRAPVPVRHAPPGMRLAAPSIGVPGEICWWTGSPHDAKCCSYEGLALPVCVTYPDVP